MKIAVLLSLLFLAACCPPKGLWPMPPGCGDSLISGTSDISNVPDATTKPAETKVMAKTQTQSERPIYPAKRPSIFPPSCNMVPDAIGRAICEDYKQGYMIFWQEEACDAMPFDSAKKQCREERKVLKEEGEKKKAGFSADWYKVPYKSTFVYGDIRLRTEDLVPDVSIWGGGSHLGWRDDEIFYTHALNARKVIGHSYGYIGENDLDFYKTELAKQKGLIVESLNNARAKDLDGNYEEITYKFPDGSTRKVLVRMNAIVPEFKNFLINFFKDQIDAGADGGLIDDLSGWYPTLMFDDYTMNAFSRWLKERGKEPVNYREFLKNKGYTKSQIEDIFSRKDMKKARAIPLMTEFMTFLDEEHQKSAIEIVTAIKEYARQKGKSFVMTANCGELCPASTFLNPYEDFLVFEHSYLDDSMKYTSVIPYTKMANAKKIPITNQPVVTDWEAISKSPAKYDILRLGAMESFATQSVMHYVRYAAIGQNKDTQDRTAVFMRFEDRTDLKEMNKAYSFAKKYQKYYDYKPVADVAVVFDNDEVMNEWKNHESDHYDAALKIQQQLYSANIDYVLVNPDQANNYKVIIVPTSRKDYGIKGSVIASGLTDEQLKDIKSRVKVIALPGNVHSMTTTDGSGNYAVHLFNYGFESGSKSFEVVPNFEGNFKVSFASLEKPEMIEGKAEIKTYGLMIFDKN